MHTHTHMHVVCVCTAAVHDGVHAPATRLRPACPRPRARPPASLRYAAAQAASFAASSAKKWGKFSCRNDVTCIASSPEPWITSSGLSRSDGRAWALRARDAGGGARTCAREGRWDAVDARTHAAAAAAAAAAACRAATSAHARTRPHLPACCCELPPAPAAPACMPSPALPPAPPAAAAAAAEAPAAPAAAASPGAGLPSPPAGCRL